VREHLFYASFLVNHSLGDVGEVRRLLDEGVDIEGRHDGTALTALTVAAYRGHRDVVGNLLDRGADVEGRDGDGRTALTGAALMGLTEMSSSASSIEGRILRDGTGIASQPS
jgi:ankyrin repeat protein